MKDKIIVIGSGLAGLATALRLAKRGYKVKIIEKNSTPGGKLNILSNDDYTFDIGPSFISMTYEFKELENDCNFNFPFSFIPLNPLFSVKFQGNSNKYLLYKELNRTSAQFKSSDIFEKEMIAYLKKTENLYKNIIDIGTRTNYYSFLDYIIKLNKIPKKYIGYLFKNFQGVIDNNFSDGEIRKIMSLSSYFLGSTPTRTSSIYNILSHIEFRDNGYHYIKNGIYSIVNSLTEELKRYDTKIIFNKEIVDYKANNSQIATFIDSQGNEYFADKYVINSDACYFRNKVLKSKIYSDSIIKKMDWSSGMLTIYVGLSMPIENLDYHTFFIGNETSKKIGSYFKNKNSLANPYYYVNKGCGKSLSSSMPEAKTLTFVVPVPNLLYKNDWSDAPHIVDLILTDFSKQTNFDLFNHIKYISWFTPKDWEDKFNLYAGSALGLAHTLKQSCYLRPSNTDEIYNNVFYTGSSTVPGIGLPMAIISSRLTTEKVIQSEIIPNYN